MSVKKASPLMIEKKRRGNVHQPYYHRPLDIFIREDIVVRGVLVIKTKTLNRREELRICCSLVDSIPEMYREYSCKKK